MSQSICLSSANYAPSNVIDFCAYRRNQALEQTLLTYVPAVTEEFPQETVSAVAPRPRRSHARRARGLFLDTCASLSIIAMTLAFTLEIAL